MNDDCYYNIISFLDIKDINNISLVNKYFYKMSKNELIWKSFYNDKFYNIKCTIMFRDNYKKCYMLNKFLVKYKKDINNIDKELSLSNNQLVSIPTELGQLNMLRGLYLDNNQLLLLPENINKNIIKIKN